MFPVTMYNQDSNQEQYSSVLNQHMAMFINFKEYLKGYFSLPNKSEGWNKSVGW